MTRQAITHVRVYKRPPSVNKRLYFVVSSPGASLSVLQSVCLSCALPFKSRLLIYQGDNPIHPSKVIAG